MAKPIPFTTDKLVCEKCRSDDITFRYISPNTKCTHEDADKEHQHLRCSRCGYVWGMLTPQGDETTEPQDFEGSDDDESGIPVL